MIDSYPTIRQTLQLPFQGGCVGGGHFWTPYIERATIPVSTNQHHQTLLATHCLVYTQLPKLSNLHTLTLKMATAISAETLDNYENSTRLVPENRSYAWRVYVCSKRWRLQTCVRGAKNPKVHHHCSYSCENLESHKTVT
jgi:hypothetical protein